MWITHVYVNMNINNSGGQSRVFIIGLIFIFIRLKVVSFHFMDLKVHMYSASNKSMCNFWKTEELDKSMMIILKITKLNMSCFFVQNYWVVLFIFLHFLSFASYTFRRKCFMKHKFSTTFSCTCTYLVKVENHKALRRELR